MRGRIQSGTGGCDRVWLATDLSNNSMFQRANNVVRLSASFARVWKSLSTCRDLEVVEWNVEEKQEDHGEVVWNRTWNLSRGRKESLKRNLLMALICLTEDERKWHLHASSSPWSSESLFSPDNHGFEGCLQTAYKADMILIYQAWVQFLMAITTAMVGHQGCNHNLSTMSRWHEITTQVPQNNKYVEYEHETFPSLHTLWLDDWINQLELPIQYPELIALICNPPGISWKHNNIIYQIQFASITFDQIIRKTHWESFP